MQKQINLHNMSSQLNTRNLLLPFISCLLPLLVSCQSGLDEAPSQEGECTVNFLVTNYRQISFDDLSSASTRSPASTTPTDHPSTLRHLLIAVFDAETNQQVCSPIQHDQSDYQESDKWEAYRQFSITLPYGHYRVLILGFNGDQTCHITSPEQVTWSADYVPNTFLYCEELTLDKNATLDRKITLRHVVAAFRLRAEDAIPAELKKMRFISSAGGTVLDATTGYANQNTGRTSEIEISSDNVGIKEMDFTIYLFLPEEEITSNYIVQALGKNDNPLYSKHFMNVPLRINVMTAWQGAMFENAGDDDNTVYPFGINLYWDTAWADTIRLTP